MPRTSPLRRTAETRATSSDEGFLAEIVEVVDDGRALLRPRDAMGVVTEARLSRIAGYVPTPGDEVAALRVGGVVVVVAVLEARRAPELVLPDGATARIVEGRLEVADPAGRLLVRYAEGTAEVSPVSGDLRLAAPSGRVHIEAGLDVTIAAERDVTVTAQRSAETRLGAREGDVAPRFRLDGKGATITGPEVEVRARRARVTAGLAEALVREIHTRATRIETTAAAIETHAERVAVQAKTLVQDVAELLETRAGRVRSLVRGAFSLRAQSTTMKSKDDTAIDGRRVLLG